MADCVAQVGVGVLVFKDGKILLGKRKGAHGEGEYGGPGGKLDFGETIEECAAREVREETGLKIENIQVIALTTLLEWKEQGKHYLDTGVRADWKSGEPRTVEPDKNSGWEWFDPKHPPSPLFGGTDNYLKALHSDQFYFGTKR